MGDLGDRGLKTVETAVRRKKQLKLKSKSPNFHNSFPRFLVKSTSKTGTNNAGHS